MSKKLTAKEERFCEEFIIDLNGTQAAIRSGYSKKTSRQIASENLSKPYIQERITQLKKELSERNQITADMIVQELANIAFANAADFVDASNDIESVVLMEEKQQRAILSIKTKTSTWGEDGKSVETELKLHSKLSALDMLGKHIGFYDKDNQQRNKVLIDQANFRIKKRGTGS